jgi:predicted RNase H-like nuclease
MISVLGMDAPWTMRQPSGVALVAKGGTGTWRCLCVATSYATFFKAAEGQAIPWDAPQCVSDQPHVGHVLAATTRPLAGRAVDVVTVDMPVSLAPIAARRFGDDAISREFGAAGCGTHTPNANRPGALGAALTADFAVAGYTVATGKDTPGTLARLVEVYPHPALMRLLNETYRLPCKAGKSRKYWPTASVPERIEKLLTVYRRILAALSGEIEDINLPLPEASSCSNLASLKRYEDAIDALVCAWVGCRYIDGHAKAYGDGAAAIWVPDARPRLAVNI